MAVTFAVDDVEVAPVPAETVPFAQQAGGHLYLGMDPSLRVLPTTATHPLLAAVHHAFAEHRPLVLSPDAVWLTIAHGAAHHVRLHGESLRSRQVQHAGRDILEVRVTQTPNSESAWAEIVHQFRAAIADRVGAGLGRLLVCDFSTTSEVERTASEIVLM